jgi:hypothetical protein
VEHRVQLLARLLWHSLFVIYVRACGLDSDGFVVMNKFCQSISLLI